MNSFCSAVKSYRTPNSQFFQICWSKYSSTATAESSIKIPNRIPRGPTDILKALERTVGYDLSGPSYKFHDDPHLVPYNERQQRLYSLAKSAGRKAARWVRDEHPELFTQVVSDPPVMSYMPSKAITGDTVSEKMLFEKICDLNVTDAMQVYKFMQAKNIDVSQETKLALLELLCFYNCESPVPMEQEADRYYGQFTSERKDNAVNAWKGEPIVEELFKSLESLGSAPYSALLCGLYNYGAKTEGDELLQKVREKKIKLDVHAYNAMILRIVSKYETSENKLQMVMDLLKEMNAEGVKPNLGTLNSAMDTLSRIGYKGKFDHLINLMAEFSKIGIHPSLGTYALFIRGHMGKARPDPNILKFLNPLLKSMAGKELEIKHKADINFFDWAIRVCVLFEDVENAIQALEIVLASRNRAVLDGFRSMIFYNNFFRLLILKSDFPTLLKYYRRLVPFAHTASPQFYEMLFEACDTNSAVEELPGFWMDFMSTGSLDNTTIMKMLEVSVNLSSLPVEAAEKMRKKLGELASELWEFKLAIDGQRVYNRDPIGPEICNLLISLLGRGCQWRSLQSCLKWMAQRSEIPEQKFIHQALESCYEHDNPKVAVWLLKFCHNEFKADLDLKSVAQKFKESDFMNQSMKDELQDVFDESSSSSSSSESDPDGENSSSDDDSSDSEDISIPRKSKVDVVKKKV